MKANKKIGNYLLTKEIGRGNFSVVYFARRTDQPKDKQNRFAVKCINKESITGNTILTKLLNTEVSIMSKIDHPNVMKLFDYFETDNNYYLVVDYCNKGDLENYLRINKIRFLGETQALRVLRQLREGFTELRKYKVMHRDLKLSNVFLHNEKVVIGDFGLAKTGKEMTGTQLGTPLTMAPEQLAGEGEYSAKTDLWAVGVLFYQLLFGTVPFFGLSLNEVYRDIEKKSGDNLVFPDNNPISSGCKKLLKGLLQMDPDRRMSWEEFFNCELLGEKRKKRHIVKSMDFDVERIMKRREDRPMSLQGLPVDGPEPEKLSSASKHKSTIIMKEVLNHLKKDDLVVENEYRYKHELNKVFFLVKTCQQAATLLLKETSRGCSFLLTSLPLLFKYAFLHCSDIYESLLMRENRLELTGFKDFIAKNRCEQLIDRFAKAISQLTIFKQRILDSNKLNVLLERAGTLELLTGNIGRSEIEELFMVNLKAINAHFKYREGKENRDMLLVCAFVVLGCRVESMFPYWIEQKKFKWDNFVVNYQNMSCQKLKEIIEMSV